MALPEQLKRGAIFIAGILLIIIGFIGLFLPVLQGFLLLTIGLVLISFSSTVIQKLLEKYGQRYPKFHSFIQRARRWIAKVIKEPNEL